MADVNVNIPGQGLTPFAFEQVAVTEAVIGLTVATFQPLSGSPAKAALIQCETTAVRYRTDDDTDPDGAIGHLLAVDDTMVLVTTEAIALAQFYADTGVDGQLNVHYYR